VRAAAHAEWTKLRTSPETTWLLLGVVVSTVATGALAVTVTGDPGHPVDGGRLALAGVQLGQAVVAVLAVTAVGAEYATGMVRVTLAAVPRRATALGAKAAVVVAVLTPWAVAAVAGSLVASRFLAPATSRIAATDGDVLRAAGGSVLYLALVALLAFGVAAAVRSPAAATGVVLGLLYALPVVVLAVADEEGQRQLRRLTPTAGLAIQATRDLGALPVGPWAGLGVLAAWTAAALLGGGLLFLRRDA
jgi:ABC-2 type transport system permease protein